jgi:hypothetical protein
MNSNEQDRIGFILRAFRKWYCIFAFHKSKKYFLPAEQLLPFRKRSRTKRSRQEWRKGGFGSLTPNKERINSNRTLNELPLAYSFILTDTEKGCLSFKKDRNRENLKANILNRTLNRAKAKLCLGLIALQAMKTVWPTHCCIPYWQLVEVNGQAKDSAASPHCLEVNNLNTSYKQVLVFEMLHVKLNN